MVANRVLSVSFVIIFCFLLSSAWADSLITDTSASNIVDSISAETINIPMSSETENNPTYLQKLFSDNAFPYMGIIILLLIFINKDSIKNQG